MNGDQRVAVVTGGAGGIGYATAQCLSEAGYSVVIVDLDERAARSKAEQLGVERHFSVGANVAEEKDVAAAIGSVVRRYGRLDVVVNNAGVGEQRGSTIEQSAEAFERLIAVHLMGTFLVSREAARQMLSQGCGAIVNISSIAGLSGIATRNAYGAAKAGIVSLTRSMACEWATSGIRVNAVAPGYVLTDLVQKLIDNRQIDTTAIERRTPMGRLGTPREIARAIEFLASDAAAYITGTVLSVDGGWIANGEA